MGTAVRTEPPPSAPITVNSSGPAEVPDPERALLSCLLRLDAVHAIKVAELVPTEWLASPVLAEVLAAVTSLAYVGTTPEPNAVLNLLRADGRANGERMHAVARLLADLYASAAVPASARHYVVAVLWESTRRRAREAGERIAQAAERVPIDALSELVERELTAVQERAEWAVRVGQL
jgi:replicative DNA helicase